MTSCDQQAMSLFMQTANDIIVHANSKRKEAIVEIYDIVCSTNTKAFQGLALSYVTMHFESLLPFFQIMIRLPLPWRTISINASIANSSVIPLVYEGGGLRQLHAVSEKPVRVRVIRLNARLRKWPILAHCNVECRPQE